MLCRSRLNTVVVQAKESRIGSKPIVVPKGVTVDLKANHLKVKVNDSYRALREEPESPAGVGEKFFVRRPRSQRESDCCAPHSAALECSAPI